MKDFGLKISFKPILKLSWKSPSPGRTYETENFRTIEVTDTLELRPVLDRGKFVSAMLVEARTGSVYFDAADQATFIMLSRAISEARRLVVPKPILAGKRIIRRGKK